MSEDDFTYEKPNEPAFLNTLIRYLRVNNENDIADLLEGSVCSIQTSGSYSRRRWNAFWTKIFFSIPVERLALVDDEIAARLVEHCQEVMPPNAGFDVMEIEFLPLIREAETPQTLAKALEEVTGSLSKETISQILPNDIREKGREMTEVYFYLYCVENSLRLFIQRVSKQKLGDDYFQRLKLNKDIQRKISQRTEEERKNRWLRVRGDSEIFYLDFNDLGSIIQNNWELFSPYFPDMPWIMSKLSEFSKCRNLVAHNSYLEKHEKDVVRVNYTSILKQLNETLKLGQ